ncbi:MAG: hypothetical protein FVQ84_22685 [Planctomycetes bacterium]|nr:hypothetical protein [Planctomycetota bacterium]
MQKRFNDLFHQSLGPMRSCTHRFVLIRFGAGILAMSGSIGGVTHARNRSGAYQRARTKPINPNTARQIAVRSAVTLLSARWADTLTSVQRTAWGLYADSIAMKNKLGETIFLSGFNHYIRSNVILVQSGNTVIDDGPTVFELPEKDPTMAITASEAAQQISVSFDNTLPWANETGGFLFTFQGSPQNAQRNFFIGPWRAMTQIIGDDSIPPTSPSVQPVSFAIAAGQRQWIYARISRLDGRLSERFFADIFSAA